MGRRLLRALDESAQHRGRALELAGKQEGASEPREDRLARVLGGELEVALVPVGGLKVRGGGARALRGFEEEGLGPRVPRAPEVERHVLRGVGAFALSLLERALRDRPVVLALEVPVDLLVDDLAHVPVVEGRGLAFQRDEVVVLLEVPKRADDKELLHPERAGDSRRVEDLALDGRALEDVALLARDSLQAAVHGLAKVAGERRAFNGPLEANAPAEALEPAFGREVPEDLDGEEGRAARFSKERGDQVAVEGGHAELLLREAAQPLLVEGPQSDLLEDALLGERGANGRQRVARACPPEEVLGAVRCKHEERRRAVRPRAGPEGRDRRGVGKVEVVEEERHGAPPGLAGKAAREPLEHEELAVLGVDRLVFLALEAPRRSEEQTSE